MPESQPSTSRLPPHRRDGFVLVCVLWVLAMLTVLTLGFGHRVVLERRAAAYALDTARAKMYARGAVYRGMLALRNKVVSDLADPEGAGVFHYGQEWARQVDLFKEANFYQMGEGYENDTCYYKIRDEQSLINVNTAPEEILEELPGGSDIMKRRLAMNDDGGQPQVFHAVEELRAMRGISDKEWFGDRRRSGMRDMVTVHGPMILFMQAGMGMTKLPRINLNTAPKEVLMLLADGDEASVDTLLMVRNGADGEPNTADDTGFNNVDDFAEKTGISGDALTLLTTRGDFTSIAFTITGVCTLRQGRVRASATAVVYLDAVMPRIRDWKEDSIGA